MVSPPLKSSCKSLSCSFPWMCFSSFLSSFIVFFSPTPQVAWVRRWDFQKLHHTAAFSSSVLTPQMRDSKSHSSLAHLLLMNAFPLVTLHCSLTQEETVLLGKLQEEENDNHSALSHKQPEPWWLAFFLPEDSSQLHILPPFKNKKQNKKKCKNKKLFV